MRGKVLRKLIYASGQCGEGGGADGEAGRIEGKEEMLGGCLCITRFGGTALYRPKTYSFNTSIGRYYSVEQGVNTLELAPPQGTEVGMVTLFILPRVSLGSSGRCVCGRCPWEP